MNRDLPGPPPAPGSSGRAPVPWWVLPAILLASLLAGFAGALMARWLDRPAPAADALAAQAQLPAPFQALAASGALVAAADAAAPAGQAAASSPAQAQSLAQAASQPASPVPLQIQLSGVLMVDDRPAMALVGIGRAPAALLRVGDRLSPTAVLASIEAHAIWVQDGTTRTRVGVSAPAAAAAAVTAATQPLPAAEPRSAEGPALPPAAADAAGTGNAAFRAAIEDKIRAMSR